MKRLPLVAAFLLFIVLCASAAYWAMQLFKPPVRTVAAPQQLAPTDVKIDTAAGLFGGRRTAVAVASNFQLKGVIAAGKGRESIAILVTEGKPAQAVRVDMEVAPGVTVKEVHSQYVLLAEGGVTKRVELPESAKGQGKLDFTSIAPVPVQPAPIAPATNGQMPMMPPPSTVVSPPQAPNSIIPGGGHPGAGS